MSKLPPSAPREFLSGKQIPQDFLNKILKNKKPYKIDSSSELGSSGKSNSTLNTLDKSLEDFRIPNANPSKSPSILEKFVMNLKRVLKENKDLKSSAAKQVSILPSSKKISKRPKAQILNPTVIRGQPTKPTEQMKVVDPPVKPKKTKYIYF